MGNSEKPRSGGPPSTIKIRRSGASQSVLIPAAYRLSSERVIIRKTAGSIILTPLPVFWDELCNGDPTLIDGMLRDAIGDAHS